MHYWIISLCVLGLAGCQPQTIAVDPTTTDRPMRVVSLDYCADQYALKLLDRDQILALSPDAAKSFSYMREMAEGLPTIRPQAEDVLVAKPDLIIRSYGGGPKAKDFFEAAGVPVVQIGWANDIAGIKSLTRAAAQNLGQAKRGEAIISDMEKRLDALNVQSHNKTALYMTPTGVTSGSGSLIHEMLISAGYDNFQTQIGWRSLPLERLTREQPDVIAAAYFESAQNEQDAWSAAHHPIAQEQLKNGSVVNLQGAWTSCSGWYLIDAIEALANAPEGAVK